MQGESWQLLTGDCREQLKSLPDNSVDAVVTDPPYGFSNMTPDLVSAALVRWASGERDFIPDGRGFMGKDWDSFVPPPAVWDECLRVLKPGGHLLSFFGSRTMDIGQLSIRLAGFEIRDNIAWMYGSGFPKSLNVGKSIEAKILTGSGSPSGQRRAAMGDDYVPTPLAGTPGYGVTGNFVDKDTGGADLDLTTPEAEKWQGWGTALKPAFEPIVVARKPLSGTVAETVLEWGTGGLNIDGSRIGTNPGYKYRADKNGTTFHGEHENRNLRTAEKAGKDFLESTQGRWPANVILDEVTAGLLDEQSGVSQSRISVNPEMGRRGGIMGEPVVRADAGQPTGHSDSGGASRFFYCAKASGADREEGLEDFQPQRHSDRNRDDAVGGDNPRNRSNTARKNFHPTVKPTALMRYLVKLVTPPGGTVLDPFAGSGSTGKAALLEGFDFIGVEISEEYLPIIEARLRWVESQEDNSTLF